MHLTFRRRMSCTGACGNVSECVPLCVNVLECKMRVDGFADVFECVFGSVGDGVDVPECTGVCERVCFQSAFV